MACFSPLSFLPTINVSTANASSSLFPSLQKPRKSTNPKRHHSTKVACNANQNNLPAKPEGENIMQGNRRDVLIGLGGLSAASLAHNPFARADPVCPDVSFCGLPTLPAGAKVIDFKFPTNQPSRIRRPAHRLSGFPLANYKKAIELMKALPADDPRNFAQQANVHCAYCDNSYHQVGYPNHYFQVHFSWLFFPFHRWYLYFFERILGSLIDDPTFALPFWNWDHPDGMEIPFIFTDTSPLYDSRRDARHQPPVVINLNWNRKDEHSGDKHTNLKIMHKKCYEVTDPICFFGKPFAAGGGPGSIELVPHNTVHNWTGDRTQPKGEDMGAFYSAARDPIFYSHHANVDRMWNLWKSFGRSDIDDTDYLDSSFLFYDENKNLVRVKTKDCLDTTKLGYDYEAVEILWAKDTAKPTPRRTKAEREANPSKAEAVSLPFSLNSIVSTVVSLPKKSSGNQTDSIVFKLDFDRTAAVKFDVLIDEEEDAKFATPLNSEFAGSFVNVPHAQNLCSKNAEMRFTVPITELLKQLEATDDDSIVVTLVPQYGGGVIIKDITIEPC